MVAVMVLVVLVVWVGPAAAVGKLAQRRELGFLPYFVISLIVSWLIALVIVLFSEEGEPRPPQEVERIEVKPPVRGSSV